MLSVKVAVFADATDQSMPIVDLAQAVAERGFTGLFLNEHPHFPIDRSRTPDPAGHPVAERYWRFWDPYIALSFAAATTDLEIGPFVSLVGEHDAIALGKAIATLDVLSGGRLTVGVGFGWHREEFEDHGHPASVRAAVVEETVELMRRLWIEEESEFHGKYRRVSRCRAYPKPAQKPHPPILLGARASERNFDRIVRWADGWIPQGAGSTGIMDVFDPDLEPALTVLRAHWKRAGRDSEPAITIISFRPSMERLGEAVHRAEDLGIERLCFRVPDAGEDVLVPLLDRLAVGLGTALHPKSHDPDTSKQTGR